MQEATEITETEYEREQNEKKDNVFSLQKTPKLEKQESDNQPMPRTLAEHSISTTANKISPVLASNKVPDEFKDALSDCITNAGNEAGVGLSNPILVKAAFPLTM